jgi:hypothetical protein
MLAELRRALTEVFPEECFLSGLSVKECRRVFSLRLAQGEAAIGIQLDHRAMNWPREQPRCDALFVCSVPGSNALVIVLVELKGSDVERALDQIISSANALCKRANAERSPHTESVKDEVTSLGKTGHGHAVLGVIVPKRGGQLDRRRKSKIWKDGRIEVWIKSGELREVTCRQLAEKMRRRS